MILRKLTDRVDVLNATLTDGYGGQKVRDWDNAVVELAVPALLQPMDSTEDLDRRDTTVTRWRLFLGPDVIVNAHTRVNSAAHGILQVDGDPGLHTRRGVPDHYEAVVVRATDALVITATPPAGAQPGNGVTQLIFRSP